MEIINLGEGKRKMLNLWPNVFCESIKDNLKLGINRQSIENWKAVSLANTVISSGWIPGSWSWTPALQYSCLEDSMDRGTWETLGSQRVRHDWAINTHKGFEQIPHLFKQIKKIYDWQINTWKDIQYNSSLGKCKLKPQQNTKAHLFQWLILRGKKLILINAGQMGSNRNSQLLLMDMQNSRALLENSLSISYKVKHRLTYDSSDFFFYLDTSPSDLKIYLKKKIFPVHQLLLLLFSRSVMFNSLWPHGLQHAGLPCPSPSSRACSNSCPLSQWCQPTISSSVISFFSCPQSFPASGSFLMSWLFASGGQNTGISASVSGLLIILRIDFL